MKSLHWSVRILAIAAVLVLFVWIADQNISFAGYKTIHYAFGDPGPQISELQPVSRVGSKQYDNKTSYQDMYEDPVYFDVIVPVTYRKAHIELRVQNHTATDISLGIGEGDGYILQPLKQSHMDGAWSVLAADIDMSHATYQHGKYRFVISVPGLVRGDDTKYVQLSAIDMTLQRQPFSIQDVANISSRIFDRITR